MDKTFDNGNFNRLQDTFIGSLLLFILMSKMDDDDWDLHHIVYRTRGGGDEADNLMMLHPNCHRQYHAKMDGDNADANLE